MRNVRAIVAGFGTAGMLAAAAACALVLGSAVVAFHGFPGGAHRVTSADAPLSVPATRAPKTRLRRPRPVAPATARTRTVSGPAAAAGVRGRAPQRTGGERLATDGVEVGRAVPRATPAPPAVTATGTLAPQPPPADPVLSATTKQLGGAVQQLGGQLGTTVSPLNAPLGVTVTELTSQLGQAVSDLGGGLDRTLQALLNPRR